MSDDSTILGYIAEFYLSSRDFNGVPVRNLRQQFALDHAGATQLAERLVRTGQVDLMFGNVHPNTHIRAFSHIPSEKQLKFLNELGLSDSVCVYPARKYLASLPLDTRLEGRPFDLELAKGAGQLEFRAFDLSVLEHYRNDPRYYYETNFISGSISIRDEFFENASMPKHDQVLMQTFGFAYDTTSTVQWLFFCAT